jgi:hypothetical protein
VDGVVMVEEDAQCNESPQPNADGEASSATGGGRPEACESEWGALLPPLDGEAVYRVRAGYVQPILTSVIALSDGRLEDEDAFPVRLDVTHFRCREEALGALAQFTEAAIRDTQAQLDRLRLRLELLREAEPQGRKEAAEEGAENAE